MGGNRRSSYNLLKAILKDMPLWYPVEVYLEEVADDPMVIEIMGNIFSPAKMSEFNTAIGSELEVKESFIRQATALKLYYQQKANINKST